MGFCQRKTIYIFTILLLADSGVYAEVPEIPKIDNVVMVKPQPQESDPEVIWYDDFDGPVKSYGETSGGLTDQESFGGSGCAMVGYYEKGSQGEGNRKVFFGDSPTGKPVHRGEKYEEIYWRVYVKHQYGWTGGGPDKLSRATSLVTPNWAQAMIGHVWSSGETLTLDPASGILDGQVATQRYNDFDHLHWLGNKPTGTFPIFSTQESGRWVCVEAHIQLNTPGQKDGTFDLWMDGKLQAQRTKLDWCGTYTEHRINAVFLETYWNAGSPVTQSRWMDDFIISPKPIGPVFCPRNPTLIKTRFQGAGELKSWEMEIAEDASGKTTVWKSNGISDPQQVQVNSQSGRFLGKLADQGELKPGTLYFVRVRQQNTQDEWSNWSDWHQPFRTESDSNRVEDWRINK